MSKIIITIVGKDRVGIVARTCNYLAENGMNILVSRRRFCRSILT